MRGYRYLDWHSPPLTLTFRLYCIHYGFNYSKSREARSFKYALRMFSVGKKKRNAFMPFENFKLFVLSVGMIF